MFEWMSENKALLWSLSAASFAVLIASFFLIPFVVARIRPDYFAHEKRPDHSWINLPPTVRVTIHIGKNILGAILMVAGLGMLALPGPGMVTLMVGFFLLDFPGKYRFERWLVARPVIHRPINWLRRRSGRSPLVIFHKERALTS